MADNQSTAHSRVVESGGGVKVDTPSDLLGGSGSVPEHRSELPWHERKYDQPHCWQYDIRLRNREEDLRVARLTEGAVSRLTVHDFDIHVIESDAQKAEARAFINRHEWLGNVGRFPKTYYVATYGDLLGGVLVFGIPFGIRTEEKDRARLIQRGACISWSPPNLASALIMASIKDMVATTDYRMFVAYSDPTAMELGTVYQACNFYYLGALSDGSSYISPYTSKPVSERLFTHVGYYKKYAKELGIEWDRRWASPGSARSRMLWDNVPDAIKHSLQTHGRAKKAEATRLVTPGKGKYAYVLGRTKAETRHIRNEFLLKHPTQPYPKIRGDLRMLNEDEETC